MDSRAFNDRGLGIRVYLEKLLVCLGLLVRDPFMIRFHTRNNQRVGKRQAVFIVMLSEL